MIVKCPLCCYACDESEYSVTWDWSGPHCPKCGNTGMEMIVAVAGQVGAGYGKWKG